ncbi:hypothetical protein [Paraburkholderia fungorum]|uniref:hypothetical protein n=1 Tax=Paraburkholderia fungorum TaxID=134537 RepID=UPI00160055EE|nr:hypothetical protein [Paraburkholderia fungorum]
MTKKSFSADTSDSNETTEQALVALTMQIKEFVQGRSLDSRFAAKLLKRLKKEADAIAHGDNATKPGQKELKKVFDAVDAVLRDHDAALLVTANAALRETDNTTASRVTTTTNGALTGPLPVESAQLPQEDTGSRSA